MTKQSILHVSKKPDVSSLEALHQGGFLSDEAYARAKAWLEMSSQGEAAEDAGSAAWGWRAFFRWFFLVAGVGFLAVGVIFFFAYNWASLHRLGKLGLLASGIGIGAAFAWKQGLDTLAGRCALFFASVMVGGLLAVMGQVYQSGADAYQFFLLWAILIAGWVWVSEFAILWGFWIFLWNLTLWFFISQTEIPGQDSIHIQRTALFFLNMGALAVWEVSLKRGISWLDTPARWAQRSLFAAGLFFLSASLTIQIFDRSANGYWGWFLLALYALIWAGAWLVYVRWRLDLFVLASLCLSFFILSSTWLTTVFKSSNAFFWLSLLVLGEVILAVWWLRWLHQHDTTREQA